MNPLNTPRTDGAMEALRDIDDSIQVIDILRQYAEQLEQELNILTMQRPDTLANELRALLGGYTAQERVDLIELITQGYCTRCGYAITEGSRCKVLRAENPAHGEVWCGPVSC